MVDYHIDRILEMGRYQLCLFTSKLKLLIGKLSKLLIKQTGREKKKKKVKPSAVQELESV